MVIAAAARWSLVTLAVIVHCTARAATLQDRFNYNATDWIRHNYGPKDWNLVKCSDVATCPGWPTNYEALKPFIPYNGTNNTCKDCSSRRNGVCAKHRQSPIPLNRNVTATRECIDRHLMRYGAGECHVDNMKFQILPHVLRTYQPNRCPGTQPNIDFSMGFPYPWLLKFTDITIPSHHTQDGKRYDAEVVMTHVYSRNNPKKMVRTGSRLLLAQESHSILISSSFLLPFMFAEKIGNLAIFLERGKEADHYDFLELYIRHWRAAARAVKDQCALRQRRAAEDGKRRDLGFAQQLRSADFADGSQNAQSVIGDSPQLVQDDGVPLVDDRGITFSDDDLSAPNVDDVGPRLEDDLLVFSEDGDDETLGIMIQRPYFNRTFQPYDWYAKAKTWYYFRYVGSTPEPPCFELVHWRVLKDPIKVAPSQLLRLESLLYNRVDPVTCKRYTAGTRRFPNRDPERLAYNRPLQTVTDDHRLMYCECADFKSRAENDAAYCNLTMAERGVFNFTNSTNGTSA